MPLLAFLVPLALCLLLGALVRACFDQVPALSLERLAEVVALPPRVGLAVAAHAGADVDEGALLNDIRIAVRSSSGGKTA
jgi:hypothetical protein